MNELMLFWRKHERPIKYVIITALMGAVGKGMLVAVRDGADIPTLFAPFVPAPFTLMLTFLVHKHLWGHPEASLRSYVGGKWSASYAIQFVAGHSAFIVFAVVLGWQYVAVSVVIGFASMVVTFTVNQWGIFRKAELKTSTA